MKHAFSLVTILSLFVVLAFGFTGLAYADDTPLEECEDVVLSDFTAADIQDVDVSSDGFDIVVVVTLCGSVDRKVKYRVHFDYTDDDGDAGNEDPDTLDPNPNCLTTSDDTMKYLGRRPEGKRNTGPGVIELSTVVNDDDTLTYTVGYDELTKNGADLTGGETVLIWVDTQHRGIQDRAPDTNGEDGCSKPQDADPDEVIEHTLAAP